MNQRDRNDTYAPWEVRPAYRRDPKPDRRAAVALSLLSFAALGVVIAQTFLWLNGGR